MKEAMFYEKLEDKKVICRLCPNMCIISENQFGKCICRKNIGGKLISLNYERISSIAIDKIEKKPLHRWNPGTYIFSFGSYGCNMHCGFCQNYEISQNIPYTNFFKAVDIIEKVIEKNLLAIAYTYNEPIVFYEMVIETAILARERKIKNVLVTNGYINEEPLKLLLPYIDAMNVDLKTYDNSLYKEVCGGELDVVLNTIKLAIESGVHVEITCLIVPGLYDDFIEIEKLFKRVKTEIGDIYIHLSRYFPRYNYDKPKTDINKMIKIKELALKYFTNVALGNV